VRKLAQLDLRHDAEFLAREVFSSFPGLHELMPAAVEGVALDLFDDSAWPTDGQRPGAKLLQAAARLATRIAPGDARCHVVVGCHHATATGIALKGTEFEYEYSRRGDGTVPIAMARLPGAGHGYIDCDHSDLPLDDRVIAGTIDLVGTGITQQFSAEAPPSDAATALVRDSDLRELHRGKLDWPHMSPAERRLFLDNLNEAPRGALGLR